MTPHIVGRRRTGVDLWLAALSFPAALFGRHLAAQGVDRAPSDTGRPSAHVMALARIGASGLRSLLSASGNLGDLQNRAGSYRMAVQLERARTGALEGTIAGLESALDDPALPTDQRGALRNQVDQARAALASVPRYEGAYRTVTSQVEALMPFGFVGDRPVFLLLRGRGHARWGGTDGLSVFSEGMSVGPMFVAGGRWLLSPGVTVGRSDVGIDPFRGHSGSTSVGPRLDLGGILNPAWSATVQLAHVWARDASRIVRADRSGQEIEVRSEGWSRTTSAKFEVKGRFSLPVTAPGTESLVMRPLAGVFLISASSPPSTNSLGERGVGPFGERETVAALRAGASFDTSIDSWSPSLYVGFEQELTNEMSVLVHDPQALLLGAGGSWSWTRMRRLVVDYALLRGVGGIRRVSELTLVLVLDG